ncbi:hypothetical protein BU24DRAFT_420946 [Aaosphaeria arxii CBS 175.79]|uniref:protein-histidine N-methyltransferase n=1 Tax=Aaosphaeria arxii CBS 175.79 TaxID=1450172 RepID=A0A6A5XYW5_9PLEO|nr:uncharacterized protein BU24DRAFT_420946 [Aaosphaeria arxii CBS 175.79]KAF2017891.1 hypothetical protein BU24DRAFT_420946 [Aaosphaeria arxii CBS 175.79]
MSFSFGFSGDDIEEDPNDVLTASRDEDVQMEGVETGQGAERIPARSHTLDELLSTLPDKLSYSILKTTSPKGNISHLPRRELFDIRLQLMAEDDSSSTIAGLDASDVQTNVYEGGYKTWECSLDLISYLLDRGPRKDLDDMARVNHVIEMGCGTALPSLLLFQYAIKNQLSMNFTLTDYNFDVLRLVTVPNLLLTWASTLGRTDAPFSETYPNPLAEEDRSKHGDDEDHGDLEIAPEIVEAFKQRLAETGITMTLVSGSWTPTEHLLDLIPSAPELNTFILGSETIYSPEALTAFTESIVGLMKRVKSGKTIVAAKRVYFGVGGSVDGFREECAQRGCVAYEMDFEGLESNGVRRCLVEVQMC